MTPPRFLVFLLVSIVSSLSAFAEPIEIFYFANQKAYRVEGFEDGKPKLEEYLGQATAGYTGLRHESWWVKGELPLVPGQGETFSNYGTKRIANSYQDRHKPRRYSVWVMLGEPTSGQKDVGEPRGALTVVGWIRDGRITRHAVSEGSSVMAFEISEEEFGGYPVRWLVEDGRLVEGVASEWDEAFLGLGPPDLAKLAGFRDSHGRTALHYAAANGDRDLAERLVEMDKRLVRVFDNDDVSPLRCAAENGRAGVVDLLLEHKAPLSDGWEDLTSVVRKAANSGHFETLKLMATDKPKGAEAKWHYSWAASDALNSNYEDIAMYLIELGADFTIESGKRGAFALSKFSMGYPELGFRLLEKFKLPPTLDDKGYNLLHSVASYADVSLLAQVRELGVDLSQQSDGMYPVDHAVGRGNVDAICWFLDNGGRYAVGESKIDPMKHAIANRQLSSVECLISYGYDVNRELAPSLTSLMYAAYLREFEIARAIASAGGVFLMDSPHLDVTVSRLLAGDDAALVGALIDQGWGAERRLFGVFSLADCAEFFGADAVLAELEARSANGSAEQLYRLSEVDQKPSLASPMQVEYPQELQGKYGPQQIVAKVAIAANGVPVLVQPRIEPGQEDLLSVVERALYSLRFSPAIKGGEEVPVVIQARVPLEVDFDMSQVFEASGVSEKPSVISKVRPLYPYELQFRRVRGEVIVEFVLMPDGSVRNMRAIQSNHEAFARSALDCIRRSTWKPARNNGEAVACRVRIPIRFAP